MDVHPKMSQMLGQIVEHPDDYQKLLEWYPLADLDQLRYTLEAR